MTKLKWSPVPLIIIMIMAVPLPLIMGQVLDALKELGEEEAKTKVIENPQSSFMGRLFYDENTDNICLIDITTIINICKPTIVQVLEEFLQFTWNIIIIFVFVGIGLGFLHPYAYVKSAEADKK